MCGGKHSQAWRAHNCEPATACDKLRQAKAIHVQFDGCTCKKHGKVLVIRVTAGVLKVASPVTGAGSVPGSGAAGQHQRLTAQITDVLAIVPLPCATAEAHVQVIMRELERNGLQGACIVSMTAATTSRSTCPVNMPCDLFIPPGSSRQLVLVLPLTCSPLQLRSRRSGRSWTQARHASGGRPGGIGPNMSSKVLLGHVGRGGLSRRGPHEQNWHGFECQNSSRQSTERSAQYSMIQAAPHSSRSPLSSDVQCINRNHAAKTLRRFDYQGSVSCHFLLVGAG
ncbi:hypothetical protein HaLaN_31107 [Haematococcus lacustris]|uniref:Uncharacterized protein n=1 Tax=Haematococcus lacustris TaxID=44745 RepID=A0A6A0AJD5_HAELA|nr:hypothetical protein HaLaN_31107 [Haematococcus lacustris]